MQCTSSKRGGASNWSTTDAVGAVRRLLHLGPGAAWYERLDTDALATILCDFFVDKVKQIKVRVEHSLHGTPSDNRLTEPTLIKPKRSLKSFTCVSTSEVERLNKSAPMKTLAIRSTTNFCCQVVQCGVFGSYRTHHQHIFQGRSLPICLEVRPGGAATQKPGPQY